MSISATIALAALGFSSGVAQPVQNTDAARFLNEPEYVLAFTKSTQLSSTAEAEIDEAQPAMPLVVANAASPTKNATETALESSEGGAQDAPGETFVLESATTGTAPTTTTGAAPTTTGVAPTTTTAAPTTTTAPNPVATLAEDEPAPAEPSIQGNIYVSTNGQDQVGRGSSSSPFRTVQYAIDAAETGDTVIVGPGTYEAVRIQNRTNLTLRGEPGATLSTNTYHTGAGLTVEGSTDIRIEGLAVTKSLWGIVVKSSSDITLRNNHVGDIGQEGISVKHRSTRVEIVNNVVDGTGRRPGTEASGAEYREFGEGIYLGTGGLLPNGAADVVSHVLIQGNEVMNITSEGIDIKASVTDVTVRNNRIHHVNVHSGGAIALGRGTRVYRGNMIVEGNVIWAITARTEWADAIGLRVSTDSVIRHNVIFDVEDYGILVDEQTRSTGGNVTIEDNFVLRSGRGAYVDRSESVPVLMADNLEGDAAQSLLDQVGGGSPANHIPALLAALRA